MVNDTIVSFSNPAFGNELSDLVREGARRIIAQAVEAELNDFLQAHVDARDAMGRRAVVRNGYQPQRRVLTSVGPVTVRLPKTRDRDGEGRCFRSQLLPPYLKKTRRLEAVIPWLYLKGVSTNDFDGALQALFGESVKGLSPARIARLKRGWEAEYAEWRTRDWQGHEFVYLWADGIYTNVRAEERRCILVVVGLRRARTQAFPGDRGRFPRVRGELEGAAAEPEGPGSEGGQAGDRRRRARLLGGTVGRLSRDARSALLGPQDRRLPGQGSTRVAGHELAAHPHHESD